MQRGKKGMTAARPVRAALIAVVLLAVSLPTLAATLDALSDWQAASRRAVS